MDDRLQEYSRMVDEYAWYGRGDIVQIAKLARELNRESYMQDIADRKMLVMDADK